MITTFWHLKPLHDCYVIGEFKMPVEPQNITQVSVNVTKWVEIRKPEMCLHLSGHMEICQYAMQTR